MSTIQIYKSGISIPTYLERDFLFIAILILTLSNVAFAKQDNDKIILKNYSEGVLLFKQNMDDNALVKFKKVIELKPDSLKSYIYMGRIHSRNKRYTEALKMYNKAMSLDSGISTLYLARSTVHRRLGKPDAAIDDIDKAVELKPDSYKAYFYRGATYRHMGKLDLAITNYNKAIEIKPDYYKAYNNIGIVYRKLKKHKRALANFNIALDLKPDYAIAIYNRGQTYSLIGQYELAIDDLKNSIALQPEEPESYNDLAWLYATAKDSKYLNGIKAVEYAKKACEYTEWKDPTMLDTLAAAYARKGQYDKAIEWQKKSIKLAKQQEDDKMIERMDKRLQLYQKGFAYTEEQASYIFQD